MEQTAHYERFEQPNKRTAKDLSNQSYQPKSTAPSRTTTTPPLPPKSYSNERDVQNNNEGTGQANTITGNSHSSFFRASINKPQPIPSPRSILRQKLHRKRIERSKKPKYVCFMPPTNKATPTQEPSNDNVDNGRQSAEAYISGTPIAGGERAETHDAE